MPFDGYTAQANNEDHDFYHDIHTINADGHAHSETITHYKSTLCLIVTFEFEYG